MRLALAALVVVSACRFEATPAEPGADAVCDCADGRDVADAPADLPVAAGDTARVTPDEAGQAEPGADSTDVAVAPSGLAIPVAGVTPDDLVDTFAAARSEGRTHNAIDILASRGTPVVAAAAGEVLRLFESEKGGLTVYVWAEGAVHYYAHLDAYAPGLAAGQRVRRGQRIGTVGDSGNAAPGNTHLHFAIWQPPSRVDFWDGAPVNPYPLLAR